MRGDEIAYTHLIDMYRAQCIAGSPPPRPPYIEAMIAGLDLTECGLRDWDIDGLSPDERLYQHDGRAKPLPYRDDCIRLGTGSADQRYIRLADLRIVGYGGGCASRGSRAERANSGMSKSSISICCSRA